MKYFEVELKSGTVLYLPFGSFYLMERETSSKEKEYLVGITIGQSLDINEMNYDDWQELKRQVMGRGYYD